jgi:uncharacterized membrane protein
VNELGEVAGRASIPASKIGPVRAGLYRGSFTDLGDLPGRPQDYANAVNDHGVVVGSSGFVPSSIESNNPGFYTLGADEDDFRAFVYDGSMMQPLSGLDGFASEALDINNNARSAVGSERSRWAFPPASSARSTRRHDAARPFAAARAEQLCHWNQ